MKTEPSALTVALLITLFLPATSFAHEGHSHALSRQTQLKIVRLNTEVPKYHLVVQRRSTAETNRPELATLFDAFKDKVNVRFDRGYLFVESNGMPDHSMMTGVTAWQQQVPLPQAVDLAMAGLRARLGDHAAHNPVMVRVNRGFWSTRMRSISTTTRLSAATKLSAKQQRHSPDTTRITMANSAKVNSADAVDHEVRWVGS
ncbi:MAG: hypothetical protein ABGZ23_26855 [Fuerstiella sp.]